MGSPRHSHTWWSWTICSYCWASWQGTVLCTEVNVCLPVSAGVWTALSSQHAASHTAWCDSCASYLTADTRTESTRQYRSIIRYSTVIYHCITSSLSLCIYIGYSKLIPLSGVFVLATAAGINVPENVKQECQKHIKVWCNLLCLHFEFWCLVLGSYWIVGSKEAPFLTS